MLPKYRKKSYILDRLHEGVVMVCVATTVISAAALVYKGYYYYRYVRPALREEQFKTDEELLKEGEYKTFSD